MAIEGTDYLPNQPGNEKASLFGVLKSTIRKAFSAKSSEVEQSSLLETALSTAEKISSQEPRTIKLLAWVLRREGENISTKDILALTARNTPTAQQLQREIEYFINNYLGVEGDFYSRESEEKRDEYRRLVVPMTIRVMEPIYDALATQIERSSSPDHESHFDLENTRRDFAEFIKKNKTIKRLTSYEEFAAEIYTNFYSVGDKNPPTFGSAEIRAIATRYDQVLAQEQKSFETITQLGNVQIIDGPTSIWKHALIAGGAIGSNDQSIGRFYLNLHPLAAPRVFRQVIDALSKEKITSQAKIPKEMDEHSLIRADKMVIYFNDGDEKRVVEILEQVYLANSSAFLEEIPRFSTSIADSDGQAMRGVGFGEEPTSENSFGTLRSEVLARVLNIARHQGLDIDDPRFDFESHFRKGCRPRYINPDNPAFNAPQYSGQFTEIRKRSQNY